MFLRRVKRVFSYLDKIIDIIQSMNRLYNSTTYNRNLC